MKNKFKGIVLSLVAFGSLMIGSNVDTVEAKTTERENEVVQTCEQSDYKLKSNQTELFYMYSTKYGNYFLDPKTDTANVIYVGHEDMMFTEDALHHGKKFIGTFADDTLWELIDLELMNSELTYCDKELSKGLEDNQTSLFYMYSNEVGHYFLDVNAEYENVIYVGKKDIILDGKYSLDAGELHHGEKFVGTFVDNTLWELIELSRAKK